MRPVDTSAVREAGNSASTYPAPGLVTTGANELVVASFYAHSLSGAPTTLTVPSSLSQRTNFNNFTSRSMTTADALQSAAGTSTAFGATASVAQAYALACALGLTPGS